jgi:hypothetical protein
MVGTLIALYLAVVPPTLGLQGPAELVMVEQVATAGSEVKITFSPDGQRVLWGVIGRPGGPGGLDIWECRKRAGQWGLPAPVAFDSPQNDFDPSFAQDGSGRRSILASLAGATSRPITRPARWAAWTSTVSATASNSAPFYLRAALIAASASGAMMA